MKVRLKCGEEYNFHIVKFVVDNGNGTIEIVGNFKPRGRYKSVVLFKFSIDNLEDFDDKIRLRPYFCKKCKRNHSGGEVYFKHSKHYGKKEDLIPSNRILKADFSLLREMAKKQIESLLKRMDLNPKKASVYRHEINKLLIYEGVVLEDVF